MSICLVSAWSGYLELDRAFLTSSTGISLHNGNLGNEQTLKQAENDVANEVLGYMYYFCSEYRDIVGPCKNGIHATWSSTEDHRRPGRSRYHGNAGSAMIFWNLEPQTKPWVMITPQYIQRISWAITKSSTIARCLASTAQLQIPRWSQFPGFLTYGRWLRNHR